MRKLTEIAYDMLSSSGYLTRDGKCVDSPTNGCVVMFRQGDLRFIKMSEEIAGYLKEVDLWRFLVSHEAYEFPVTAEKLSDGRKEDFSIIAFFFYDEEINRKRFQKMGFTLRFYQPGLAWSFFMHPEEYKRLAEFLKDAGVEFQFDAPPWLSKVMPALNMKHSSERPGKDAARFLGYG